MNIQTRSLNNLITLKQASDMGYGSVPTLRRRIHEGVLPAVKVDNKQFKCYCDDLDALIKPAMMNEQDRYEALVKTIANSAPELLPDQREELAKLLRG